VLYYRAQHLGGQHGYIEALCGAIEKAGGQALPLYCASLRTPAAELLDTLTTADAMVVTVLAAGGAVPPLSELVVDDDSWNVAHLAALDVPDPAGAVSDHFSRQWDSNDDGLSPLDVATQVAVPEFDGRIITVPFSFKEIDDRRADLLRRQSRTLARVAGLAVRHARLRTIPPTRSGVAVVFSAYPTKHARIGNAVGLDTPGQRRGATAGDARGRLPDRRRAGSRLRTATP